MLPSNPIDSATACRLRPGYAILPRPWPDVRARPAHPEPRWNMALRLVEAFIPTAQKRTIEGALEGLDVRGVWKEPFGEDLLLIRVLVEVEASDAVVGALTGHYEGLEGFQAFILPVEAAVPRARDEEDEEGHEGAREEGQEEGDAKGLFRTSRVSIEELHAEVQDMSRLTNVYIAMVVLSTIVAAIGLLQDSVAIVIGSMVIAPLLGPSVALSLATTLADWPLGRHALKANVAGLLLALGIAFAIGLTVTVDATVTEIASRTRVSLWDVVLGLAVGGAGVLSVTTGVSTALVGVMVAVALLPPLVVAGLLAGSGLWAGAWAAGLLLVTYVMCINLAGVLAFLAQGVRPRRRWEAERARRAAWTSIGLWLLLLAILAALIRYLRLG